MTNSGYEKEMSQLACFDNYVRSCEQLNKYMELFDLNRAAGLFDDIAKMNADLGYAHDINIKDHFRIPSSYVNNFETHRFIVYCAAKFTYRETGVFLYTSHIVANGENSFFGLYLDIDGQVTNFNVGECYDIEVVCDGVQVDYKNVNGIIVSVDPSVPDLKLTIYGLSNCITKGHSSEYSVYDIILANGSDSFRYVKDFNGVENG